jgi:hypothetical protein
VRADGGSRLVAAADKGLGVVAVSEKTTIPIVEQIDRVARDVRLGRAGQLDFCLPPRQSLGRGKPRKGGTRC